MDTMVKTYTFDELDDFARERVIERHRAYLWEDPDWWDAAFNGLVEEFKAAGVGLCGADRDYARKQALRLQWDHDNWYGCFGWFDIGFDIYSGWGDYVRFTADVELATFMRHRKIAGKYRRIYNAASDHRARLDVSAEVRRPSRWSGMGTTGSEAHIEVWGDDLSDEDEAQALLVQEELQAWVDGMTHKMLVALYDDHEDRSSEEYIRDWCMEIGQGYDVHGNLA